MHSELTKVAGKLRMDASRGDLNEIRTIMHSITLKWAYLIRLATDIMVSGLVVSYIMCIYPLKTHCNADNAICRRF